METHKYSTVPKIQYERGRKARKLYAELIEQKRIEEERKREEERLREEEHQRYKYID